MKRKSLCAAVVSGLLFSTGAILSPQILPGTMIAEAAEAQSLTATVDGSLRQITLDKQGNKIYPTIREALSDMEKQQAKSYVLQLKPGTYREKIQISLPNLLLKGSDASTTTIIWDDAEGTPLRPGDVNGDKTTYTMNCATVQIEKEAAGFRAVNITFANDFPTEARRADKSMKAVQAFAIRNEADRSSFYQCRFLGRQDTLYANAGRQYYRDCYIEGDVDFIFGQASAAVFEKCEIKSLMRAVADDGKPHSVGYVAAPSTLAQDKGFLFYKCHLFSDIEAPHYALLGRPWHPSSEKREVNSAAVFRECRIDTPMKEKAWNSMKNKFGVFQPEDNRLFEYKNTGTGAIISENRRQLTDVQAADYTPEKFLGDWKPEKRG